MKKLYCEMLKQRNRKPRKGRAGRHPLPGVALANNTYDGFGKGCFVPVPEDNTEDEALKDFFPDENEDDQEEN